VNPGQHLVPRRPGREPFELGQQIVGKRLPGAGGAHFELAVQRIGHVTNLNHA
jgi:hypothetical protein